MLAILEEELLWDLAESTSADSSNSSEGLGFSNPPAPLGTSVRPLLEGRPVPFVQFCSTEPTLLLSGHGYQNSVRQNLKLFFFFRPFLTLHNWYNFANQCNKCQLQLLKMQCRFEFNLVPGHQHSLTPPSNSLDHQTPASRLYMTFPLRGKKSVC